MITLGFSPCPNDTFIFYGIVKRRIDIKGLNFKVIIDDVETLNHLALRGLIDVSKISCHTYYYIQKDYVFLRSGGAFGRGCGPLLVQRSGDRRQKTEIEKIAIPGDLTTALLLLKLYLASESSMIKKPSFIAMPFYKIIDAVRDNKVDAGLIIHESRFTYHEHGLKKVVDLGEWWESVTGLPIPLGGIVAKRSLGEDMVRTIESLIRASVEYSLNHKDEVMPFIKDYSQELSEEVILRHIDLYVNNFTIDIGIEGDNALQELVKRASLLNIKNGGGNGSED